MRELLKLELILVKKGPRNSRTPNQYALNLDITTGQLVQNLDQSKILTSPTSQKFVPVLVKKVDSLKRNTGNTIRAESGKQIPGAQDSPTSKRKKQATPAPEPEAFGTWYKAFPRHEGREDALKIWRKLDPGPALTQAIMTATAHYAAAKVGTETTYIKQPATWLNGKRWEDEIQTVDGASTGPPKIVDIDPASGSYILEDGRRMNRGTYERNYGPAEEPVRHATGS